MHSSRMIWRRSGQLLRGLSLLLLLLPGLSRLDAGRVTPQPRGGAKEKSGENDPARFEEAKNWIARSLAAYGGSERLAAITDLSFESQSSTKEISHPSLNFKVYFKGSDKFRTEVSGSDFFALTIVNGPGAWLKSEQTLIELMAGDVEPLMISTELQSQPYAIYGLLTKFWSKGDRTVDGVRYAIIGTSGFLGKDFARGEISLDPQTFLIRRFEYEEEVEGKQGLGVKKYELHYDDYHTTDGISWPSHVVSIQSGVTSTLTLSNFKFNPGVPDSFFEKPK